MDSKVCRVCLADNVRMHCIGDIGLRELFEKVTNTKFNTEDGRPITICYICCLQMQRCHRFSEMSRRAEKMFTDLVCNDIEITLKTVRFGRLQLNLETMPNLSMTTTTFLSLDTESTPVDLKEELDEVEDNTYYVDDIETDSEDSEYNTALGKLRRTHSRSSKEASPVVQNGSAKKSRKSKEEINTSRGRKSKNSLTNGQHEEKTNRKRSIKQVAEVVLHAEALEQLVKDVLKHKDCWPFYDPVSLDDVPDYLEVIDTPMDFTTIKNKLDGGEYSSDDQLISDAALVLRNCYVYNQPEHSVAKSGCRLERYINKRCSELALPTLPNMDELVEAAVASDDLAPKSKRAKLK